MHSNCHFNSHWKLLRLFRGLIPEFGVSIAESAKIHGCHYFMKLLFEETAIDTPDPLGQELLKRGLYLNEILDGIPDSNWASVLHEKSLVEYEQVAAGLLYGILTNESLSERYFELLAFIVRDGFSTILHRLKLISNGPLTEPLCYIIMRFMRQIKVGNCGKDNIVYTKAVVDFLIEKREMIVEERNLSRHVIFMLIRIMADHAHNPDLRAREETLLLSLISSNIQDCVFIGRDFIRSLMDISQIPSMEKLLLSIIQSPSPDHPNIPPLEDFIDRPTPREFLIARLNPEMEIRMVFILNTVPRRLSFTFIEHFRKRFLVAETETLLPDIIRYICRAVYPNNIVLASDIIQRWNVISILLRGVKSAACAQSCKLSLYFDWLFFNHINDSVMSLEPGILLIMKNLQTAPALSATMLEFLVIIAERLLPGHSARILQNLRLSLETVIEKGVIVSLAPLFAAPLLDTFAKDCTAKLFTDQRDLSVSEREIEDNPALGNTQSLILEESYLNGHETTNDTFPTLDEPNISDESHISYQYDSPDTSAMLSLSDDLNLEGDQDHIVLTHPDIVKAGPVNASQESYSLNDIAAPAPQTDPFELLCDRFGESESPSADQVIVTALENMQFLSIRQGDDPSTGVTFNGACEQFLHCYLYQNQELDDRRSEKGLYSFLSADIGQFWETCPAKASPAFTMFEIMMEKFHSPSTEGTLPRLSNLTANIGSLDSNVSPFVLVMELEIQKDTFSSVDNMLWSRAFGVTTIIPTLKTIFEMSPEWFYRIIPKALRSFESIIVGNPIVLFMIVSLVDSKKLLSLRMSSHLNRFMIFGPKLESCLATMCTWTSIEQWISWELLSNEIGARCVNSADQLQIFAAIFSLLHGNDTPEVRGGVLKCSAQISPCGSLMQSVLIGLSSKPDLICTVLSQWRFLFSKDIIHSAIMAAFAPFISSSPHTKTDLSATTLSLGNRSPSPLSSDLQGTIAQDSEVGWAENAVNTSASEDVPCPASFNTIKNGIDISGQHATQTFSPLSNPTETSEFITRLETDILQCSEYLRGFSKHKIRQMLASLTNLRAHMSLVRAPNELSDLVSLEALETIYDSFEIKDDRNGI
ncbi:hypothetical protein BASA61_006063 [Batrachochytrium salamandrivorans]|nr:hypothetical protein BASA61_006063 [Batrachochytrium salamandrivorans]